MYLNPTYNVSWDFKSKRLQANLSPRIEDKNLKWKLLYLGRAESIVALVEIAQDVWIS